jgi:hypothetical protein
MITHRLRGILASAAVLPLVCLTGCGKSSSAGVRISYLSVTPTAVSMFPGRTQAITVLAHYSDGTTAPASAGVTFTASAPTVATISAAGVVTAVGAGTGTISASVDGKSADATINVSPTTTPVFTDGYAPGVSFTAFGGSVNALAVDATEHHGGASSLKIAVPATGYTGGALTAAAPKNLSLYNAVTFWAKASKAATLNVAGFGNDAQSGPSFSAEAANVPLTTTWTRYVIPVPAPAKLNANVGLFHFAEGAEEGAYSIWMDDIQYENLPAAELGQATSATLGATAATVEIGKTAALPSSNTVTYANPALTLTNVSTRYFDLASSAPSVATVSADGTLKGLAIGTSTLTAKLGALDVPGSILATVIAPIVPTVAPPAPTVDPSKVISLLTKAYTNRPVDTWGTAWSNGNAGANLTELTVGGDLIKKYAKISYVGVEFTGANVIDASGMTYFHVDVWTPDMKAFQVKLVDFGADGAYGGGDDTEAVFTADASTTPALTGQKQWASLNIPLANFNMNKKHLAQLLFVATGADAGVGTAYIDNVYFHNSPFIDTVPPVVTITDSVSGPLATGPVTFTLTFSEELAAAFPASAVTVAGGTMSDFKAVSPTVYTLVVTPTPDSTGTMTVSVAAGSFRDLANNASTAGGTDSQDFDTRAGVQKPMDLPVVTFDSPTILYGLAGFGGAEGSTIAADPAAGTNKVVKVVKTASAELWAGTTLTADGTQGFLSRIPFSAGNTKMTVRVYSPDAGIPVRLKVEDHTNSNVTCETEALTTKANAWETLVFDFGVQATGTPALDFAKHYDKASIFFNFGVTGATAGAKTYYFDDVLFNTFSTLTFDSAPVSYTLAGFGGAEDSTVVADPAAGATDNKVVKVVKTAAAETWAGTTVAEGTTTMAVGRIPFSASMTRMFARVYSPDAGIKVRLKVEDASNGTVSCETEATTTKVNTWETLTFDFAAQAAGTPALDPAATYNKASIFFNFGTSGAAAGAKTYYFDDLTFDGFTAPITFDSPLQAVTLAGFGGAENSSVVADPAPGTTGNQVVKVVKTATAELWAGTTFGTGAGLAIGRIPFTAGRTKVSVRVYSPDAGIKVRLKVEDASNGTVSCETEAVTQTSNAWETLTFDFTANASGTPALDLAKIYDKASIFFNFGTTGATAGAKTYYFDDVTFLP